MSNATAPATSIIDAAIEDTIAASTTAPATEAAIAQTLAEREYAARLVAVNAAGKLDRVVEAGRKSARDIIQRVMSEVPTDYIVPARGVAWHVDQAHGGIRAGLMTGDGVAPLSVHPHALGQALTRYAVPKRYLVDLAQGDRSAPWSRNLAAHTLREHADHDAGKMLVRTYGGQIRAFLSDRYRRLDSRPLLDAFLGAIYEAGLVVYAGTASEVRTSMRALLPEVIDIEGDPNVFGLEWSNSDYGAAKLSVRTFFMRLVCINGMIGEQSMSSVHLGRQLSEDLQLSRKTYDLDSETMASATVDVVRASADPARVAATVDRVRAATRRMIDAGEDLPAALRRAMTKGEQDRVRDLFESSEAVMLPPAPTTWRMANAVSWMANTADNPDRRLELERLAGELVLPNGTREAA